MKRVGKAPREVSMEEIAVLLEEVTGGVSDGAGEVAEAELGGESLDGALPDGGAGEPLAVGLVEEARVGALGEAALLVQQRQQSRGALLEEVQELLVAGEGEGGRQREPL